MGSNGNSSGSVNVVNTFNSNFAKIIALLNTANPTGGYTIEGNDTICFTNISESTCDAIFGLDMDPNPYSGGSFITLTISDILTNVNSNNTTDVTTVQTYHPVICDHSSRQANYNTALSYNAVIQNVGTGALDLRYKINNGVSIGSVIDYATAPFTSQSSQNVQKLISGSVISSTYTPANASSILVNPMACAGGMAGGRRMPPRRLVGRM